ncbi:MAG: hypothetical protein ACYYKD_07775 [Rhodospirillales bacterium]
MTKPKAVHFTPAPAPAEAGPYDDPHAEAAEEGRRQIAEGKRIPHDKVVAWLNSWGTENELPPPTWDGGPLPDSVLRQVEDIKSGRTPVPEEIRSWLAEMPNQNEDNSPE